MYGVDERGKVYVHIKVYKQQRVFAEMLVHDGDVKIGCRECIRWHRIVFKKDNQAELEETQVPAEIKPEGGGNDGSNSSGH
jgi:hypothetical protein